jgi:hypothetical protein
MIFPLSILKRVALASANDVPHMNSNRPRAVTNFILILVPSEINVALSRNRGHRHSRRAREELPGGSSGVFLRGSGPEGMISTFTILRLLIDPPLPFFMFLGN